MYNFRDHLKLYCMILKIKIIIETEYFLEYISSNETSFAMYILNLYHIRDILNLLLYNIYLIHMYI